jgi:hypothetical protein
MKFTIFEWTEQDGNFTIKFTVASNQQDRLDAYQITVPFTGEDPQLFMNKLRNYMVSHVSYLDNMKAAKRVLRGFSFTDPTVHYYEDIGENNAA